jgi:small subunit ribosomal protein S9
MAAKPALRRRVLNISSKQFSTSTRSRAGIAAPEINFKNPTEAGGSDGEAPLFYARLVPDSPSYFTAQPVFTDDLLSLQNLLQRYASLPVVKPGEAPRVAWQTLAEYRNIVGEPVKATKYQRILEILHRLNHIHPSLMPAEVTSTLNQYKREVNPFKNTAKSPFIDEWGKALGVGRRKTSTARAWVVEGTGEILINGKTLAQTFGRVHDRESAVWALKATGRIDKYNVWALVSGGGTTGQAEAMTLAVAKALLAHEPDLKPALRRGKPVPSLIIMPWTCTERRLLTCLNYSGMYNSGSKEGGEEEARKTQGSQDASLGQEIGTLFMYV